MNKKRAARKRGRRAVGRHRGTPARCYHGWHGAQGRHAGTHAGTGVAAFRPRFHAQLYATCQINKPGDASCRRSLLVIWRAALLVAVLRMPCRLRLEPAEPVPFKPVPAARIVKPGYTQPGDGLVAVDVRRERSRDLIVRFRDALVYVDGEQVTDLMNGEHVVFYLSPGVHRIARLDAIRSGRRNALHGDRRHALHEPRVGHLQRGSPHRTAPGCPISADIERRAHCIGLCRPPPCSIAVTIRGHHMSHKALNMAAVMRSFAQARRSPVIRTARRAAGLPFSR